MVTFDQRYNADMRGKYIPGRQTISAKPYGEITVKTERATAEAVREKMQQMNGYQVPVARLWGGGVTEESLSVQGKQ